MGVWLYVGIGVGERGKGYLIRVSVSGSSVRGMGVGERYGSMVVCGYWGKGYLSQLVTVRTHSYCTGFSLGFRF